jgi:hypothetical protein
MATAPSIAIIPRAADHVFAEAAPVERAEVPVVVEVDNELVDDEPEPEPEPALAVEPDETDVVSDAVEAATVLFFPLEAVSVELVPIENVVGLDIGICEVSRVPFDVVAVAADGKDIVASGTVVTEPVAVPESPVAAKDQVAVFTDGVAALSTAWLSARTVATEAITRAAENFMMRRVM